MGTNGSARKGALPNFTPKRKGADKANPGLPSSNDDDGPVKVTPMKKEKSGSGTIKLKKPAPKHSKPGNWRDGSVIDGAYFAPIFAPVRVAFGHETPNIKCRC